MEEITIRDIARICGVGVSTVSRAINNHPDINPETKETIMRVIKENNYVPNNSARNLKRQDAKAIAVLVNGINNSFFSQMIKVLQDKVDEEWLEQMANDRPNLIFWRGKFQEALNAFNNDLVNIASGKAPLREDPNDSNSAEVTFPSNV